MIKQIKTLLGIKDDLQDDVLEIIVANVRSHLRVLLGKDVPQHLNFIVLEISVRRFNRLGTEGMKSESVEGHKIDFYDLKDEFAPYMDIINAEKGGNDDKGSRGKVLFI